MKPIKSIEDLFANAAEDLAKEAAAEETVVQETQNNDDPMDKLASELYAGGCLVGEGFADRAIEKIAMSVPAAGGGTDARSLIERIKEEIAARRGRDAKPGDDTSVRAEDKGYKGHGSDSARSGQGTNPARALPKSGN